MVRHGETDWNASHRWQGWIDVPLNARGVEQARDRADQLLGEQVSFVAVASSDLSRAHATAVVMADVLGITRRETDHGFRERFGGDWQGKTRGEIDAGWPEEVREWKAGRLAGPPNAEPLADMTARFDAALARCDSGCTPGNLLLVTHGGIQRAIASRAGATMDGVLANLEGMWFEYANGTLRIADPQPSSQPPSSQPPSSQAQRVADTTSVE